ncbi:MAG: Hsp70 family protein [Deltaproteobacteria bacterium]|nr:Hsp70 family protein [Deltaproteobacteria bacterium]
MAGTGGQCNGPVVGIDLGTTQARVAIMERGVIASIPDGAGATMIPSVIAVPPCGDVIIGAEAKRQAALAPQRVAFGIKRLLGHAYDSPAVARTRRTVACEVVSGPRGGAWVRLGAREMSPEEATAHLLGQLKRIAESHVGGPVTRAVVSVPAGSGVGQRRATRDAARIAGLDCCAIINEPSAALLAYVVRQRPEAALVAVIDVGGGKLDVTIAQLADGVAEVMATSGDSTLGGEDLTADVIAALAQEVHRQTGTDPTNDPGTRQLLRDLAERAARSLATAVATEVDLPSGTGAAAALCLRRQLTRAWLEVVARPLLAGVEGACHRALLDAGVAPQQIDTVLLAGAATRMAAVQATVRAVFGRPGLNLDSGEAVAAGAAAQGAIMKGSLQTVVLFDVTSQSLWCRQEDGRTATVVPRNATVPAQQTKVFATTRADQESIVVELLEGEDPTAPGAHVLGRLVLGQLPRAPAGAIQVQVAFTVDADGILNASARDPRSGRPLSHAIMFAAGLPRAEVEELASRLGNAAAPAGPRLP